MPESVGQRVRQLRRARGWSQQRLAVAAGIGLGTVEAIESSRTRVPQTDTLIRVADALGVGICALLGYPCERDGNALARMEIARLRERLVELERGLAAPKEAAS